MHVLITGGCGFIGHHVVAHLLDNTDWQITAVDGLLYAGKKERLDEVILGRENRVLFVEKDLSKVPFPHFDDIDYVVNLASCSSVEESIHYPYGVILNNAMLMTNVLQFCRVMSSQKVIHVSTDEVFGPAPDGVFYEEWDRHIPSNPYSASKSAQDSLCIAYWRTYGVPVIVVRTMNNYGPRQHSEKLIPTVIRTIDSDGTMEIYGQQQSDGTWRSGSRVWLHARNFADAILFLLQNETPQKFPEHDRPSCYNVVGLTEYTNLAIAQTVADIMGKTLYWRWNDTKQLRPGHDLRYAMDGTKLRNRGWKPPIPFLEGMEETVKFTLANRRWL